VYLVRLSDNNPRSTSDYDRRFMSRGTDRSIAHSTAVLVSDMFNYIVKAHEVYTPCRKKRPPFYFSNNSVKN